MRVKMLVFKGFGKTNFLGFYVSMILFIAMFIKSSELSGQIHKLSPMGLIYEYRRKEENGRF
jgi:hypothetical protein